MAKVNLTAERVRELFDYNKETGDFTRRIKRRKHHVGSAVGCVNEDGYLKTKIDGGMFVVHRVIWLHVTGAFPVEMIDHIDGDKLNNRWINLREASNQENQFNRWAPNKVPNRTSRFLGVWKDPRKSSWRVRIQLNGKCINVGSFPTEELACDAYMAAKKELHPYAFT